MAAGEDNGARTTPPAVGRGAFGGLVHVMGALGTLCIGGIMVLMNADILSGNILGRPLPGIPEIVTASLAVIVFLQLPAALRAGRMVKTDGLKPWLTAKWPRFAAAVDGVFNLLGTFMFGVLTYATWRLLLAAWETNDQFGVPGQFAFPKWPVEAVVLLGCVVMAVQYALFAWRDFRSGIVRPENHEPDGGTL